jgi:hypothetical protein
VCKRESGVVSSRSDITHRAATRADKEEPSWRSCTLPELQASRTWERLEDFVREHVQQFIQALLEEEVTELLGRTKSARREKVENATTLIWKLLQVAESTFRRLKGAELLPAVYAGVQYVDGVPRGASRQQRIAA